MIIGADVLEPDAVFTCNQLPGASSVDERKPFPGLTVCSDPCGSCPGAGWQEQLRVGSGLWFIVLGQS